SPRSLVSVAGRCTGLGPPDGRVFRTRGGTVQSWCADTVRLGRTRRRDDGGDRRGVTVWPFSRWRRSRDRRPERPPARCLRCGETALPGYVMTPGSWLGWKSGELSWLQAWLNRSDITLIYRFIGDARYPGHRCPACGLILLESPTPTARPSHNPRRDDVADRRGGVTGALAGPRLPGVRPRHAGDARGRAPDVTPGPGWRTAPPLLATAAGGYAGPQSEGGCDVLRRSRRCRPVARRPPGGPLGPDRSPPRRPGGRRRGRRPAPPPGEGAARPPPPGQAP